MTCSTRPTLGVVAALAALTVLSPTARAAADPAPAGTDGYRLRVLADTGSNAIENLGCASINGAGDVAFVRVRRTPDRDVDQVVRLERGDRPQVLASDPDRFDFLGPPVVNDRGQVAFSAVLEEGEEVLRVTPRRETVIARTDPGRFGFFAAAVSLNNDGVVAFKAELDERFDFAEGMYSGSGGRVREYYRNTTSDFEGTSALASINDSGRIAFGERVDRQGGIFLTRPNGGFRTVFAPQGGADVDDATLNDRGEVAFERFTLDDTGAIVATELVTGRPGALRTLVDGSGRFASFGFTAPAINDRGRVAYAADLDDGSGGVFVGAAGRPVVRTGDVVDGDPVVSAVMCENGLNDRGELAVTLTLDDADEPSGQRQVLVRAVPRR